MAYNYYHNAVIKLMNNHEDLRTEYNIQLIESNDPRYVTKFLYYNYIIKYHEFSKDYKRYADEIKTATKGPILELVENIIKQYSWYILTVSLRIYIHNLIASSEVNDPTNYKRLKKLNTIYTKLKSLPKSLD